jgi:hypothetical protein
LLSVFVAVWKIAPIENWLNAAAPWKFEMPALHFAVQKMPPVVAAPELEKAIYKFNILAMTGTALFLAGIVSGLLLGLKPGALARLYGRMHLARAHLASHHLAHARTRLHDALLRHEFHPRPRTCRARRRAGLATGARPVLDDSP